MISAVIFLTLSNQRYCGEENCGQQDENEVFPLLVDEKTDELSEEGVGEEIGLGLG